MKNMQNKRVLVTGAGGALGRALSQAFATAGCEVVVTDIHRASLDETVRLVEAHGSHAAASSWM